MTAVQDDCTAVLFSGLLKISSQLKSAAFSQ